MNKKIPPPSDPSHFHGNKELDPSGHMSGTYVSPNGTICSYTINAQTPTARYPARGSVSLVDPRTGHIMNVKHTRATISINAPSTDAEVLRRLISDAATSLYNRYILRITDAAKKAFPASETSFALLLAQHQQTYLNRRTRSVGMAHRYASYLEHVAQFIGEKAVSRIPQTQITAIVNDLGPRWREHLQEAARFLDYVYDYRADSERANPFTRYLDRYSTDKVRTSSKQKQKQTGNTDVLSIAEERDLNRRIEAHIENGILIGIMLVKEGGLSSRDVCHLTWSDITPMPDHPDILLIALRRDNSAGATHDYTFPLMPFGSRILLQRLAWLRERYSDEQIHRIPVASVEKDPAKRLDPSRLTADCRNVLHNCGIGYAALAGLQDLHTGAGIRMLLNTYKDRLEDACRLKNDPGLLAFMLHHSLTNLVQADHYRSFTDPTAQHMLYTVIHRDHRLDSPIPSRKQIKRKKHGCSGEQVVSLAPSAAALQHLTLTATIQPNGELKISAPTGLRIVDIQVTPINAPQPPADA